MKGFFKHIIALIGYGLIFSFIGGLTAYIYLNTRFTVEPWHLVELQEEFDASKLQAVPDFASYLKLEERLFKELHEKVYQKKSGKGSSFNRYVTGSRSDPSGYGTNWNRSFEMPVVNPRGGVLMLHGLSDSPYSMRALAENLHAHGFWVVGLRLPGHGTIPAELARCTWQDWAAATRIGMLHLRKQLGQRSPLYIVGYSTGAALGVEYSLEELADPEIPLPEGLVLLSPAIGLPPVAALARAQLLLAGISGLDQLEWLSVMPEYDPYKYNSFPVNAGEQIYLLTKRIQTLLDKNQKNPKLQSFPRVLVFQSIADATVLPETVIEKFMVRLPPGSNTLVLFDVNIRALTEGMLVANIDSLRARLLQTGDLPFDLELVSNSEPTSDTVQVLRKSAEQSSIEEIPIPLAWPAGIYSLSHVALPFPPDDPIYGETKSSGPSKKIRLGNIALRGERGALILGEAQLMRLRYNPFFLYIEERMERFLDMASEAENS